MLAWVAGFYACGRLTAQVVTMKNILLLIHDDAGQEARFQAALDLTRALEGHLTCLDVVRSRVLGTDYAGEVGEAILFEDERAQEAENRQRIAERLRGEDVAWTMVEDVGDLAVSMTRCAGLADIIVVNRKLDSTNDLDMRRVASDVVLKSRKPILAVPDDVRGFDAAGAALVAWDGSLPAMAALTAAVPLLKLARSVELLEIQGPSAGTVREAAEYLSRHGIHAEVSLIAPFKDSPHEPSAVIRRVIEKGGHAYCVMGAYGHSRVREALLGGVTRNMLSESRVPLVLAH